MDRLSRAIARLVTAMIISFGVRPPGVAVLELLQRPSVRIVMITRRRQPQYAALFRVNMDTQQSDPDSSYESASEEGMVESPPSVIHHARSRTYTLVRTA